MQFRPRTGIIAPLLPVLRDLTQPLQILPPGLIRLKIVAGRIRTSIAVLQRRHCGAQYRSGLSATEKPDETVSIADSNGLVTDRSKVARAIWKQQRENLFRAGDLRVIHDCCIGGIAIPIVQRGDQGAVDAAIAAMTQKINDTWW